MKLKDVVDKIKQIATEENVHPSLVKMSQVVRAGITAYDMNKLGGFNNIKKKHFPIEDKDLAIISSLKKDSLYIAKLEKALGEKLLMTNQMKESLTKLVTPVKIPKANLIPKKKSSNVDRDVVVMVNDTHFGLIVDKDDVNGVNAYNWEVACRRMSFLAHQVADYKIEKRSSVKRLHIVINGDIIQGFLHDTKSRGFDLLGTQQNGALHILTHFIGYVSQFFPAVTVHLGVGNHDNNVARREGGNRIISHIASDSFLTPIFYALTLAFRNEKKIQFNTMSGLYLDLELPGGRACAVHGDILFSKSLGNPGSSLNIKGLSDAINRFNSGEQERGKKKFDLILTGHTHVKVNFITFDGVEFYNAPSLSGTDGYAHSLGINSNLTGQLIFESTKSYIFGDPRLVLFKNCDIDKSLDKIIPTFKGQLKW